MKHLLILLLVLPIALVVYAKDNGKVNLILNYVEVDGNKIIPSNKDTPHASLFDVDSILQVRVDDYLGDFVDLGLYNRSNDPIIIDWENARLNWSKIIFSTDRPINMDSQSKPQETIYPGRGNTPRQITSRSKYIDGVWPLYDKKELRNGKLYPLLIEIPIILKNGDHKLYSFRLEYKWLDGE